MALLSPGIQIFESSVTPPAASVPAGNGVATLGFSKKGPTNKLVRVTSVSEFAEVFGDPMPEYPYAHIMAQSVLANGTDVYFMRLADPAHEETAQCPVIADLSIKGAKVAVKNQNGVGNPATPGYITMLWNNSSETVLEPANSLSLRIEISDPKTTTATNLTIDAPARFSTKTLLGKDVPAGYKGILYVSLLDLRAAIENSKANEFYDVKIVGSEDEVGIVLTAKNSTDFVDVNGLVIESSIGYMSGTTWMYISGSESGNMGAPTGTSYATDTIGLNPLTVYQNEFAGENLNVHSSLYGFDTTLEEYNRFNLVAKNPGSGMNGVRVVKTTVNSSVGGENTWTVSVLDKEAQQPIETRTGITPDNFFTEMSKFNYIDIIDAEYGAEGGETKAWSWVDGTWELGTGTILSNGNSWNPATSGYAGTDYVVKLGDDGFPTILDGQYSEEKAVNLYVEALGKDDFINTDEYSFSILATPGCQNSNVQNAAIGVCTTRGDAIYLADIPRSYCESKQGIDDCVAWANGNSAFQSSYCAIYYGWFAQTNPYDTDNSIMCPASCFIAPKMAALDRSMGEFYAPAGLTRGTLICSDWSYSPDQKDRDKLVGNDNVINPISYSNTRGVTIMAQKTTDRTTSPLNRVGIRRMTNAIKRNLRSRLYALLFEPNNETARAKARTIVDNIMSGLKTIECIEYYDINVVSGTGANRNDLNVYLSFAPYGLIEKIYVYLSITDAGVEVAEEVA